MQVAVGIFLLACYAATILLVCLGLRDLWRAAELDRETAAILADLIWQSEAQMKPKNYVVIEREEGGSGFTILSRFATQKEAEATATGKQEVIYDEDTLAELELN